MNYGLYLSASGVLTNMYRQDVFSNNLANARTVGFKPDIAGISQRPPESVEDGFGFDLRQDLLDKLGGGVFAGPQHINFDVGRLERTENPLDVALETSNAFFAVATTDANGRTDVALTRDGRFTRSGDNFLVTMAGGRKVLDASDAPIALGTGPIQIDRSGRVLEDGEEVGRLQIAEVANPRLLRKLGSNLFRIPESAGARRAVENAGVLPGFVESSGTEPIRSLMKMIKATSAVSGNGRMIRFHDALMDRAVNTLGRVVA
ncbi:MAG: hypothetical protein CMJ18_25810 [Phycisphaeraceae bacterium]|nr:hypothetical protein [Phycisphaeraceae bacterium]